MTLNYIGSKKKLIPFIEYVIFSNTEPSGTFGDLFAGTGIVGEFFSKKGFTIISNDTEKYSYVINYATLKSSYTDNIKEQIEILNKIDSIEGLIYNNYSSKANRLFFSDENAKKADGIRNKINELKKSNTINDDEYYFLLASLIQSLDTVANTTSVYGAFLKKIKKSAQKSLVLKPIHTIKNNENKNKVFNKNILELDEKLDVIYLDPPYVARQYGANYCPLNFLVEYDPKIELKGVSGLYDYYKSPFASKSRAKKAFEDMFRLLTTKSNKIFLSYNNQGILSTEEITDIMKTYGSVTTYKYSYKKYQATKQNGGRTEEYIHYLSCDKKFETKEIDIIKDEKNILKEK
jgi:adenine-specific DNA-methyltransferase